MGFTRPDPTPGPATGTLIDVDSGPVVSLVMPTRTASRLRSSDRRRLAHHITNLDRRLVAAVEPSAARARIVRRLWALADQAGTSRARQGLVLVAASGAGRQMTFDHPVTSQALIGDAPSYRQIVEASWGIGRLGVVHVSDAGARLVAHDHGTIWEPQPPWDPVEPPLHFGPVQQATSLATASVPATTPLVLAGDRKHVETLCGLDDFGAAVAAVLPSDPREITNETLVGHAQQALRRRLDAVQLDAMAHVAIACDHGSARCGPDARYITPSLDDILVTELGPLNEARRGSETSIDERIRAAGGTVVVVPDGFLAHVDHMSVVPRVGEPLSAVAPATSAGREDRQTMLLGA